MKIHLSREKFFIASVLIVILFWGINRFTIINESNFAAGVVIDQRCWGNRMTYCNPVILFNHENDSIIFEGETDLDVFKGDSVTVIYRKQKTNDAEVWSFGGFWGVSIIIALFIILLVNAVVFSFLKKRSIVIITLPSLPRKTQKQKESKPIEQIETNKQQNTQK